MRSDGFLNEDELELELLSLVGEGVGSVARLVRLAGAILRNCDGAPAHVVQIANISTGSHQERDLHRWVGRQEWRKLLPDLFEFEVPITLDSLHMDKGRHACILPHELFGCLYNYRELFNHMFLGGSGDQLTVTRTVHKTWQTNPETT